MEYISLIASIVIIHLLVWLTPGPMFVLIIRNAMTHSRTSGLWTALGITLGTITHITLAITGIGFIITASPQASSILKFLGAGYLFYLGCKTLLLKIDASTGDGMRQKNILSRWSAFRIGFVANLLSPVAVLFFGSVFATVISAIAPWWVTLVLATIMPFNSLLMASILTIAFTHKNILKFYSQYHWVVNKILGVALIVFAAVAALR